MKRYLVYPFDFDARAVGLDVDKTGWDDEQHRLFEESNAALFASLKRKYGEENFERTLADFIALGARPFSIVAHHNRLYHAACEAFLHGLYYPALTAACALGERMLNHLILDLRDDFQSTPDYEAIKDQKSFSNWGKVCTVLKNWDVFQTDAVESEFRSFSRLRHRSLHFNAAASATLREDALKAFAHLSAIIADQFGFARTQRWLIPGTAGAFFIRRNSESDPFLKRYYLPQCPLVGPLYSMTFAQNGLLFFDTVYPPGVEINDEEFARQHNTRDPKAVVANIFPPAPGITVQARVHGAAVIPVVPAPDP